MQCQATFHAHADGVNAVACLPAGQGQGLVLSAGKDHHVRLWQATQEDSGSWACHVVAQCVGHADAVEGMALSPSGDRLATCGWDGALLLWRTGAELVLEAEAGGSIRSSKKRKVGGKAGDHPAVPVVSEAPAARLEGHLHCVSSVAWPQHGLLYSGGWDHSVRRWDAATGVNTDTYNGSKVVSSVASSSGGPDVVAFGGADRALRVWDSRSRKGEALAVQAYPSHGGWVSCVRWSPTSAHHVATASHDATVKLWDLRSPVPLGTMSAHTDKVLSVAWVPPAGDGSSVGGLVSGGADCTLQLFAEEALA